MRDVFLRLGGGDKGQSKMDGFRHIVSDVKCGFGGSAKTVGGASLGNDDGEHRGASAEIGDLFFTAIAVKCLGEGNSAPHSAGIKDGQLIILELLGERHFGKLPAVAVDAGLPDPGEQYIIA